MDIRTLTLTLTDNEIATRVGVTPSNVRASRRRGKMPACWYLIVKSMCDERGIDCPSNLFAFRSPPLLNKKSTPPLSTLYCKGVSKQNNMYEFRT